MGPEPGITDFLTELRQGRREAMGRLFPLVYEELRRIAHRQLGPNPADPTLGTTALVHEAYLRLVDQTRTRWQDRAHFFAVGAMAMRQILVDHARQRGAAKRGGGRRPISLDEFSPDKTLPTADDQAVALLDLHDALTRLAEVDERLSRVVECRFFGGLTEEETAEALGVTARTVRRDWTKAKGLLYEALSA